MSLRSFRAELDTFYSWAVPDIDEADTFDFPYAQIARAMEQDSFEAGHAALDACDAWLKGPSVEGLANYIGRKPPVEALVNARAILDVTLPYYDLHPGGFVEAVPHDARRSAHARIESLERAALFFDVAVTAFRYPVKSVDLYNTADALRVGPAGMKDLVPVGQRSEYKVSVMDGQMHHPPLWPSDAAKRVERNVPETDDPGPLM